MLKVYFFEYVICKKACILLTAEIYTHTYSYSYSYSIIQQQIILTPPYTPQDAPDPGLRYYVLSRRMQNVHGALTRCMSSIFTVEASLVLVETTFVILFSL